MRNLRFINSPYVIISYAYNGRPNIHLGGFKNKLVHKTIAYNKQTAIYRIVTVMSIQGTQYHSRFNPFYGTVVTTHTFCFKIKTVHIFPHTQCICVSPEVLRTAIIPLNSTQSASV